MKYLLKTLTSGNSTSEDRTSALKWGTSIKSFLSKDWEYIGNKNK